MISWLTLISEVKCFSLQVLKYSEDDLPELLEAARKVQRDIETEKVCKYLQYI